MARSLGALTVDLILRLGGFTQGMDRAARETDRRAKQISSSINNISRSFRNVAGLFGVGFSTVAITRGLIESTKAAIEYGDEVQKAADKTGIAASDISELAFAAKQSDIELDGLATGLKKMQVAISQAGSGNKEMLKTFNALGIEFEELRKLSPDEQFELIAEQISRLQDDADRTRAAVALFGKAGADLLPLFKDGAAGIRAAREEAQRLGVAMTDEQIRRLAEADDSIKRLGQSWQGLTRDFTALIAVPLTQFFDGLTLTLTNQDGQVLKSADRWKIFFEALKGGPLAGVGALTYLRELGKAAEEAGEKAAKAGGQGFPAPFGDPRRTRAVSRSPAPPGFLPDPAKIKETASETDRARERIQEFITTLRDQTATFGLTQDAVLKYRVTLGDLARDLADIGGAEAEAARQTILDLSETIGQQATSEKTRLATEQITEQISQLEEQAATIGLTDQQAFAYSVTQGFLSEKISETSTSAEELTRRLLNANNALAESRRILEQQRERESIFEQTRTDAEQYTATLERLNELFRGSTDQETYGRAVADAAGEYIQAATAGEEYRKVVTELNRQFASGELSSEAHAAAVSRAKDTLIEAQREASQVFVEESKRIFTDALTDFLSFEDGFDNIVEDADRAFRRMAASAVSARIADKLFEGFDEWFKKIGSGLGSLFSGAGGFSFGSIFSGIRSFFGFASGGYTGSGGKYEPAGIVHRGEGVLDQDDIRAIGGPHGFAALRKAIRSRGAETLQSLRRFSGPAVSVLREIATPPLPGYATGGMVGAYAGNAPVWNTPDMPQWQQGGDNININQTFNLSSPDGRFSQPALQQVATSAARGARTALARNG